MVAYINFAVLFTSFLIAFLLFFIKGDRKLLWMLKTYFVVMMILELISYYLAKKQIHNHYLFNYYTLFEITVCSLFFYFFVKNELKKISKTRYILFFSGLSILIILINIFYIKRMGLSTTFMSVPLLMYCFMSFYFMMDVEVKNDLYKMFIISTFLMHSVSLLIFIALEVILTFEHRQQTSIFFIRSVVFLLAKVIVLIPILRHIEKRINQRINVE